MGGFCGVEFYSKDHNIIEGSFIWSRKKVLGQKFEVGSY
jgi:hypothetical protein